jgi:hypothetical protein
MHERDEGKYEREGEIWDHGRNEYLLNCEGTYLPVVGR